jgi:uncharacterized protein YbjQ (UPF0145 family)
MNIATSDFYETDLYQVKSLVVVTHTEALSLARGFVAGITGLFGGQSDIMNKKVNDVMKSLIEKLQKRLGPGEKLVGVRFEFAEFGREQSNSFLSGIATGTLLTPKQAATATGGQRGKTRKSRRYQSHVI